MNILQILGQVLPAVDNVQVDVAVIFCQLKICYNNSRMSWPTVSTDVYRVSRCKLKHVYLFFYRSIRAPTRIENNKHDLGSTYTNLVRSVLERSLNCLKQ